MTNLQKNEIIKLIETEKDRLGSFAKVATKCEVSTATISQMINLNHELIKPEMWMKVGSALGQNSNEWQIAETLGYKKVTNICNDAKNEGLFMIISDQAGIGKTSSLKTYHELNADNNGTGRKRLTSDDVLRFKNALDKLKVPKKGRVLVLCTDHVNDLLVEDKTFQTRYQNTTEGAIAEKYYGFKTYENTYAPAFTAAGEKIAYGSATAGYEASVCFFAPMTAKAPGTAERYAIDKTQNPQFRRHEIGFEVHWVCVALKDEGIGAIRSVAV